MRFSLAAVALSASIIVAHPLLAEEPATQPTSQPAADAGNLILLKPDDKEGLAAAMGKDVVIEGVIAKAAWSSTGKVMLAEFKDAGDSKLKIAVFAKNREKFDAAYMGDVTKTLSGAKVRVKGILKDFKGSPEIILDQVNQVTLLEPAPG